MRIRGGSMGMQLVLKRTSVSLNMREAAGGGLCIQVMSDPGPRKTSVPSPLLPRSGPWLAPASPAQAALLRTVARSPPDGGSRPCIGSWVVTGETLPVTRLGCRPGNTCLLWASRNLPDVCGGHDRELADT